ncbi:MAG: hypothetical protein E7371_06625, partial [Clostridiales bacterium]|nr:hypothetical protein [Clostridiales bacterium]
MSNKKTFKKVAATFLCLAMAVGATGCNFITVDNQKDLDQNVATVNINSTNSSNALGTVLNYMSTNIKKRELVSYYLSTGYQYVEQYGYTYEKTFNMLLDGLVSREIMIQYAIKDCLGLNVLNPDEAAAQKMADACIADVDGKIENAEGTLKKLYSENKDVLVFQYFLTEENYNKAVYGLNKSLNSSS